MDALRFDRLVRSLTNIPSRRGLLSGLAATAIGLAATRFSGGVEAKKKRKNKKPKQLNAFGCVDVGGNCRGNDANCCSGICQGKKPKKGKRDTSRCLAHDASTCQAGQKSVGCGGAADIDCVTTTGAAGQCQTTTGNGAYCIGTALPAECNRDADCQATFGPLAACLVCAVSGTGRLCAGPG